MPCFLQYFLSVFVIYFLLNRYLQKRPVKFINTRPHSAPAETELKIGEYIYE